MATNDENLVLDFLPPEGQALYDLILWKEGFTRAIKCPDIPVSSGLPAVAAVRECATRYKQDSLELIEMQHGVLKLLQVFFA